MGRRVGRRAAGKAAGKGVGKLNDEMKRRTKVVRIFPNEEALLRLVTALCVEMAPEGYRCR